MRKAAIDRNLEEALQELTDEGFEIHVVRFDPDNPFVYKISLSKDGLWWQTDFDPSDYDAKDRFIAKIRSAFLI